MLFDASISSYAEDRQTQFEPGKPDQFCTVTNGPLEASQLSVAAFPVAWRVEIVDDDKYRGLEFIR